MEKFITKFGSFALERLPNIDTDGLRAWDAADELLIQTVFEDYSGLLVENTGQNDDSTTQDVSPTLIINDAFGALAVALHQYFVESWSDSLLSHLATKNNLEINGLPENTHLIPATDDLKHSYKLVVIKVPKTLSLLEDQLYRLRPHIGSETIILAGAMSKHIHTSTLELFEKIIGTTTTSRATKKARLIYAINNITNNAKSPYPKVIKDQTIKISLCNHANVFAVNHLDIGTRFFIQHLDQCPKAEHIVDLGCGNGALGIIAKRHQPSAKISFVDESYSAIASAKESYLMDNPDNQNDADFYLSNALEQFLTENKKKVDLILCNPPFHQVHSIGDQIAWEMFMQSRDALKTDGELWIVGNRHLGYHIKLKKVFGNCRTIASNQKFVILAAKKADRLLRKEKTKQKQSK
jgi:16S rRNA G1207 methylase RsmC